MSELAETERRTLTESKRPRGRPPKHPPEEVRERLVEAGVRALRERGVESGLDAVGLDAAITDADVPRGMSYRIWQESGRSPQDALRHAVVLKLLGLPATEGLKATREMLAEVLQAESTSGRSLDDPEARLSLVTELVRTVGAFNHQALDSSEEWRLYNALRATAITRPNLDPEVLELLRRGEDLLISEYAVLYQELASSLSLTLREGFSIEQFTATVYALNEGLSARLSTSYQRDGIRRCDPVRDPECSDCKEWTLFSIGLGALVQQFFDISTLELPLGSNLGGKVCL